MPRKAEQLEMRNSLGGGGVVIHARGGRDRIAFVPNEADARLFIAVHDLLDALRGAVIANGRVLESRDEPEWVKKARAAIQKASTRRVETSEAMALSRSGGSDEA